MAVVQSKYPDSPPPGPPTQDEINRRFIVQLDGLAKQSEEARKRDAELWKAIKQLSQIVSDVGDRINGTPSSV